MTAINDIIGALTTLGATTIYGSVERNGIALHLGFASDDDVARAAETIDADWRGIGGGIADIRRPGLTVVLYRASERRVA